MPHFDNITDIILSDATKEEAIEHARGICEYNTHSATIGYAKYIDTVNGLDIYYDYGADYYFFVEADVEDEYDGQPDELTEWMDFDPDC